MVRSGLGSEGSHEGLLPWSSKHLMGIRVGMLSLLEGSHPALLNVLSPQQNTGGCLLQGGRAPGIPPSRCKAAFRGQPVRFHPLSAAECLLLPPHPPHVQVEMRAVPTWLAPRSPDPRTLWRHLQISHVSNPWPPSHLALVGAALMEQAVIPGRSPLEDQKQVEASRPRGGSHGAGVWEPVSRERTVLGTQEGGDMEAGPQCCPADLHEPSLRHPVSDHRAAHLSVWLDTLKFH